MATRFRRSLTQGEREELAIENDPPI
jgi:hypothetical protein